MAKIQLVANTFQIKELFKVVATYIVSGMSLRPARALSVCFIYRSMCDRNNENVKTSPVYIAYYTVQYLSPRRCTLSYNVFSVNSAELVRNDS